MIQQFSDYNIHEIIEPNREDDFVEVYCEPVNNGVGGLLVPISFYGHKYIIDPMLWTESDMAKNDILRICFTFPNEKKSRNTILPTLRAGDTMIDVGACYGSWTLPAAAMGVNVIAIEPDEYADSVLNKHIKLNKFEKLVTVIKDSAGKKSANSIDSYVKNLHIDNIKFIKIDTEGTEFDVLYGAKNTIKKFKPSVLVELHTMQHGKTPEDEIKFLAKYKLCRENYHHYAFQQRTRENDQSYFHMYHLSQY